MALGLGFPKIIDSECVNMTPPLKLHIGRKTIPVLIWFNTILKQPI